MIFTDITENLKHGREIEFSYKGKQYSITNSNKQWNFCCDTDRTTTILCAFSEFDILVEKTAQLKIDGITIAGIFNNHKYEKNSLFIL